MTTNFDMKLVLEMKAEMHSLAEGAWDRGDMDALIKAKSLSDTSPLKEFLALDKWEQRSLVEDYEDEVRRQEMAGWTTKVLNAYSEDEADTKCVCFRPLGDGTVRVWNSIQYARYMTDRDYDPMKDNYDAEYGYDGDNSEILPIAEARKRWAEMVKIVAYSCPHDGEVKMYTPAGAY